LLAIIGDPSRKPKRALQAVRRCAKTKGNYAGPYGVDPNVGGMDGYGGGGSDIPGAANYDPANAYGGGPGQGYGGGYTGPQPATSIGKAGRVMLDKHQCGRC
jgi:hypothetical protein